SSNVHETADLKPAQSSTVNPPGAPVGMGCPPPGGTGSPDARMPPPVPPVPLVRIGQPPELEQAPSQVRQIEISARDRQASWIAGVTGRYSQNWRSDTRRQRTRI